jgi:hypothetical protein
MDLPFREVGFKEAGGAVVQIAARDAMDGVGGGLFGKAQFGGEQTTPARHRYALSRLGSVVRARNELGQFV